MITVTSSGCFEEDKKETTESVELYSFYVDDDANPSWYNSTHFKTIQSAIDNSSEGDTIFVYNGVYYEQLLINKSIELIGSDQTKIIGNITGQMIVAWITAEAESDVFFCNFIITYENKYDYTVGISCSSDNSTIKNCKIKNCGYGIAVSGINNYIDSCNFYNNRYGLHISNAKFINVSECFFENNTKSGLDIYGSSYSNIKKCNFLKNKNGVSIKPIYYSSIPEDISPPPKFSKNNKINLCNFIDNIVHANLYPQSYDNSFDNGSVGNYWDDYNGTDENNDGMGDIPYNISEFPVQDNYPSMNPFVIY